jgi:Beta-eliminating lyase
MNFASDNVAGASQAIIAAIVAANDGSTSAYGADPLTAKAKSLLCEVFERESACFLVNTGTAANALALSAICPPFGAVFCHAQAHIVEDECGAPEMFTGGAKLAGVEGWAGKIALADLNAVLADFPRVTGKSGPARRLVAFSGHRIWNHLHLPRARRACRGRARCRAHGSHGRGAFCQCPRVPQMHAGRNELEGGYRRFVVRRHQERRARLRGGDIFRSGASGKPPL